MEERVQKMIADAGLCSRRAAEELLKSGRVSVNGVPISLGGKADPERDEVRVDGRLLPARERPVYLILNKPRGYVTTMSDEKGRPTVAQLVREAGARVFPVGRLDMQSEGLLLMTNDGDLMQHLIHPRYEVQKTYLLTAAGKVSGAAARLSQITELDGEPIRAARVQTLEERGGTVVLSVTIHEGKNRQIRRMCEKCGLVVKKLQRIREDRLELKELPVGKWRYLTDIEVKELKRERERGS